MGKISIFDQIVNELSVEDSGTEQLNQCMQFNYSLSRKVPLRYKIIAIGFVRHYTLEELNNKLQEYGLSKLYARNLWEASLLFAFSNSLSYEEWKDLSDHIHSIRDSVNSPEDVLSGPNVTMKILREYIESNSGGENAELLTKHRTRHLESALKRIHASEEFIEYLRSNVSQFSVVREKTRYYFCKYLYYYLERKIEDYIKIASRGIQYRMEDLMDELSIFKGASKVKRSAMKEELIRELLENASISCGVLYAEFNEFFFDYVSLDWMHILLEQAGNLSKLPPKNIEKIANAARHYDKKYKKKENLEIIMDLNKKMEIHEQKLDEEASLNSENRGYQKNRMGENTVRKYLKGALDLDRTTFICFMIFFGSDLIKPARLFINRERLDQVLVESGFKQLDQYDDFDYFVINYLNAEDPTDYLMEEVTRYAFSEENFYLYKLYQASRSDDADIKKLMLKSENHNR